MIKITHINKSDEEKICAHLNSYFDKIYGGYYEIKCYGDGANTKPTLRIVRKTLIKEDLTK